MRPHRWSVLVLLALLTSGCDSQPPTYRSLDDFSSLELADHSLIGTGSLPPAPRGFSDSDVRSLAETLSVIAQRGTYDRQAWHPKSQNAAIAHVLAGLEPTVRHDVRRLAAEQLSGRPWASVVGTVFGDDVRVIGKPRMQRATWDVDREDVRGVAWLNVRLQTRTFYSVRHHGRPSVVIMTHTWQVESPAPLGDYYPAVGFSADPVGADGCTFVLRSVITPDSDDKRYRAEMKKELRRATTTKFVEPTGDAGAATAKACRHAEGAPPRGGAPH